MTAYFTPTTVGSKKAFNIDINIGVQGYETGHEFEEFVPSVKPNYHFRHNLFLDVISFVMGGSARHEGMFLYGHAGTGKSSLPQQIAARLNIPMWTVDCSEDTELSDLLGQWIVVEGNFKWIDGPLSAAMRAGGWIVLEEADALRPQVAASLYAVIDGGDLSIAAKGGEIVRRESSFALFATGNTNGSASDGTEAYMQSNEQSLAFLDRFQMIEVPYMDAESEINLLHAEGYGAPLEIIQKMVRTVNDVRKSFVQGECPVTFSTRTALRWLRIFTQKRDLKLRLSASGDSPEMLVAAALYESIDNAIVYRIGDAEKREGIYTLLKRNFDADRPGKANSSEDENNG